MRFNQGNSDTFEASTACTPDTVQVSVSSTRHIEVEHMAHFWNIDTTSGNIGRNQHAHTAISQTLDSFGTLHLHHFAFEVAGVDTRFTKPRNQFMHTVAFTDKHD